MNICFISDLHLQQSNPHLTQLFLKFLQEHTHKIQSLYILGDFFEYWIGDDDHNKFHQTVINALAKFAKHTPVYFMHGNRDFLIGKRFAKQANCQILADPSVIDIFGRATIITHGDSLCALDKNYMFTRRILRNRLIQRIFLALPLQTRKNIALKMRNKSKQHTQSVDDCLMDVPLAEILKLLQKYQVNQIIHGHTHRPSIEYIKFDNGWARRIVLSDWHQQGNVLILQPDGSATLTYF